MICICTLAGWTVLASIRVGGFIDSISNTFCVKSFYTHTPSQHHLMRQAQYKRKDSPMYNCYNKGATLRRQPQQNTRSQKHE